MGPDRFEDRLQFHLLVGGVPLVSGRPAAAGNQPRPPARAGIPAARAVGIDVDGVHVRVTLSIWRPPAGGEALRVLVGPALPEDRPVVAGACASGSGALLCGGGPIRAIGCELRGDQGRAAWSGHRGCLRCGLASGSFVGSRVEDMNWRRVDEGGVSGLLGVR